MSGILNAGKHMMGKSGGEKKHTHGSSGGAHDRDYADKGLDSLERKYGQGKVDPEKSRATNEKITDGARNTFEKATGKKVPEKISR